MSARKKISPLRAVIIGVAGPHLHCQEIKLLARYRPWGLILFSRNCKTPLQVRALVRAVRGVTKNPHMPVFIDQEGGRVARLTAPVWQALPGANVYADLYGKNPKRACKAAALGARIVAHDLVQAGINANCMPVLDIPFGAGDRSLMGRTYGKHSRSVEMLASCVLAGLRAGGVVPVLKHMPGLGRGTCDSHQALPEITASRRALASRDFRPFARFSSFPVAMTAHALYTAYDAIAPATQSGTVVREVIRGHIKFDGLLMTDDLSMKALRGSFGHRAQKSYNAGCDMLLHCNGVLHEMRAVLAQAKPLTAVAARRAARAFSTALPRQALHQPLNPLQARATLARLLGQK